MSAAPQPRESRTGDLADVEPTGRDALLLQLAMIAGRDDASFLEVRYRMRDRGMGQLWHPAARREAIVDPVIGLGETTDVYVGACPRTERHGGKRAVAHAWCLWVDCDTHAAAERLREFSPAPTFLIRSGRDGGLHGWWALQDPLAAPHPLEVALRRLAHHLDGDRACCDAARIMRAAGTTNHKHGQPRPVEIERVGLDVFTARDVVGQLPDPPTPAKPPRPRPGPPRAGADASAADPLLTIPATVYVAALTGRDVAGDGKTVCPFHDDRTPSLHAYDDADRGWTCFGCGKGGSIIDFGGALYGLEPRGTGYHEIRRRLAADLLGKTTA